MSKVFDLPHARVTLTPVGPGVEIEVWPKAGQSAYAVVDALIAVEIAKSLVELAAAQLAILQAGPADAPEPVDEPEASDDGDAGEGRSNVVDLASRRRPDR